MAKAKKGAETQDLDASKVSLNPKQRTFCIEYIKDHNATQAAIRAGYAEKTAYSIGSENLRKPEIVDFIADLEKDAIPNAEEIKRSNIKFWQETRGDVEQRMGDRLKASELMGDSIGQFIKKLDVSLYDPFDIYNLTHEEILARIAELEARK